jgi:hypothetical protein
MATTHKDVEFAVTTSRGVNEKIYRTYKIAVIDAVNRSEVTGGEKFYVDILIYSKAGAKWLYGSSKDYDPDASIAERIEVTAVSVGKIA